ncbi:hypothetical protein HDU92_004980 [Lobulomyces angularis]|nr:hypothetical protein HDU92_004980 [Lobulomyces angularis]
MHFSNLITALAVPLVFAVPQLEPLETDTFNAEPTSIISTLIQSSVSATRTIPQSSVLFSSTLPVLESTELSSLPLPSTTSEAIPEETTGGETVGCSGQTIRKEVRQMKKDGDWEAFVSAYKSMVADGTLSNWVNQHVNSWDFAHFNAHFLPYHRIFLKKFEQDLQARGAKYLPYWDSSADSQDLTNSQIFSAEFFGTLATDGTIENGPFSRGNYSTPTGGFPLVRGYSKEKTLYGEKK